MENAFDIEFDYENGGVLKISNPSDADGMNWVEGKAVWGTGHALLIGDYYECLRKGTPFRIPGTEGAKVIQLILSMYHSHGNRIKTLA